MSVSTGFALHCANTYVNDLFSTRQLNHHPLLCLALVYPCRCALIHHNLLPFERHTFGFLRTSKAFGPDAIPISSQEPLLVCVLISPSNWVLSGGLFSCHSSRLDSEERLV